MALGQVEGEHEVLLATKKLLFRMHENILFCLESLGVWGAWQVKNFSNLNAILCPYFCYHIFSIPDVCGNFFVALRLEGAYRKSQNVLSTIERVFILGFLFW